MNRNTFLFIILIGGLSNNYKAYSQNETTYDSKELYKHWVKYKSSEFNPTQNKDSVIYQDTVVYIPYNSRLTDDLSPNWKYQGTEFGESGSLTEHIWNWCGTGNPPNFYLGSWKIKIDKNQPILTITSGLSQTDREYYLYFLNADKLILVYKR